MDFRISSIQKKDLDTIYELGCSGNKFTGDGGENCFWPKTTLLSLFKSKNDVSLKLEVNEKIVGFSLVMIHPITKKAIIENFFILDEYKNLSEKLYFEVEKEIKECKAQFIAYYFNLDGDPNSIELFRKLNFFEGDSRRWLHKNISFSNPIPRN